ncbi:MAG: hypothetical protein JWN52_3573 [Actinomycetia bacterium]|nr:hypothetical protein [Actinomycetes bacterium]
MTDLQAALRDEVKAAIQAAGLSQAQVARSLELSPKHVSQMLAGKAGLTLEWAQRIADLCGREVRVSMVGEACVFCRIVTGEGPATIVRRWRKAVAFVPLNPVTDGHVLVVPTVHVLDAAQDPDVTAYTMAAASELAKEVGSCNLITSVGAEATQTVFHLHAHIVPRREGDGLALPWTTQEAVRAQ